MSSPRYPKQLLKWPDFQPIHREKKPRRFSSPLFFVSHFARLDDAKCDWNGDLKEWPGGQEVKGRKSLVVNER